MAVKQVTKKEKESPVQGGFKMSPLDEPGIPGSKLRSCPMLEPSLYHGSRMNIRER